MNLHRETPKNLSPILERIITKYHVIRTPYPSEMRTFHDDKKFDSVWVAILTFLNAHNSDLAGELSTIAATSRGEGKRDYELFSLAHSAHLAAKFILPLSLDLIKIIEHEKSGSLTPEQESRKVELTQIISTFSPGLCDSLYHLAE